MSSPGRIQRRLTLAIVLTALVPMLVALVLARAMVSHTAARFFVPEIGARLDQALGLYQELARAVKASMRHAAAAMAAREELVAAVRSGDVQDIQQELERSVREHPELVTLSVVNAKGERLAEATRGRPLDPSSELKLKVLEPIAGGGAHRDAELVAVFATERDRFDELEHMSRFVDTYRRVESRRATDETSYVYAFALLLGITIVAAAGVSVLLARSVSSRITELASATHRVGAGDLTIRVPERGRDEIAELASAFNRMVREVEASRARIEYLQRIGAWQEMARRLAHEIKNPLTPIQLAIQELHSRYRGDDPVFADLVDSTLEIVEDEVRTLRRLVSEFSEFARLPRAELVPADLGLFLREQCERLQQMTDWREPVELDGSEEERPSLILTYGLDVPAAPVRMDRQMFRRVLVNLIQNAFEAAREDSRASVRVDVRLKREGDSWVVDIDDDGPGVDSAMLDVMFDPYFTTKHSGTGLGLAIVKKAVVEHGGSIEVGVSALGGALFRIRLPFADGRAIQERADAAAGAHTPRVPGRRGVDSTADA